MRSIVRGPWWALGAALLLACGSDDDPVSPGTAGTGGAGGAAGGSGGVAGDGGSSGGAGGSSSCGDAPEPAPSWLQSYQQDVVGRLTGELEIIAGTSLPDRASPAHRDLTRSFLQAELDTLGYGAELHDYGSGANVWAQLDATEPTDRFVLIGAHFDSMPGCPGANDNATGVALVSAVARYLRDLDCRSLHTIVVFFDEEEDGLLGSEAFAAMLASAGYDLTAAHTVDQMGWDEDDDRAIELERPDLGLFEQYEQSVLLSGLDIPLIETNTGGTDHVSFRHEGFAAVGITEGYASGDTTPHYHTAQDTYDTVDFEYLASTTTLVNVHFARILGAPGDSP